MKYYIKLGLNIDGPFTVEQLSSLRKRGRFSLMHKISVDRANWQPANTLTEVFVEQTIPSPQSIAAYEDAVPMVSQANQFSSVDVRDDTSKGWFYNTSDNQVGPTDLKSICRLLRSKALPVDTLVWAEHLTEWTPANKLEQFQSSTSTSSFPWIVIIASVSGFIFFSLLIAIIFVGASNRLSITSHKEHDKIREAVGLVVLGYKSNDSSKEGAFGTGTGFMISSDGYLLTNKHVLAGYQEISDYVREKNIPLKPAVWVFLHKNKFPADIVYTSDKYDLAILKINKQRCPYFRLSNNNPELSQRVFAAGFPGINRESTSEASRNQKEAMQEFAKARGGVPEVEMLFGDKDFEYSKTDGSVSRVFSDKVGSTHTDWIEHSASISQGNSGGPLFDEYGVVYGVNTLGFKDQKALGEVLLSISLGSLKSEVKMYVYRATWM